MPEPDRHPSRAFDEASGAAQTIPSEAFSPEGARLHAAQVASDARRGHEAPADAAPALPGADLGDRMRRFGASAVADADSSGASRRYDVQQLLGLGTTGRVYTALDRSLDRRIAVKVLDGAGPMAPSELSSFIDE